MPLIPFGQRSGIEYPVHRPGLAGRRVPSLRPVPPGGLVAPGVGLPRIQPAHLRVAQRHVQLGQECDAARRGPDLGDGEVSRGHLSGHGVYALSKFPRPPHAVHVIGVNQRRVYLEPVTRGGTPATLAVAILIHLDAQRLLRPGPVTEMRARGEDLVQPRQVGIRQRRANRFAVIGAAAMLHPGDGVVVLGAHHRATVIVGQAVVGDQQPVDKVADVVVNTEGPAGLYRADR